MKGCRWSGHEQGAISNQAIKVRELLVEVTVLAVLFTAILLVTTLQICSVWIFEYLGGPTFKWDGPIFEREGSQKYAHPPL